MTKNCGSDFSDFQSIILKSTQNRYRKRQFQRLLYGFQTFLKNNRFSKPLGVFNVSKVCCFLQCSGVFFFKTLGVFQLEKQKQKPPNYLCKSHQNLHPISSIFHEVFRLFFMFCLPIPTLQLPLFQENKHKSPPFYFFPQKPKVHQLVTICICFVWV